MHINDELLRKHILFHLHSLKFGKHQFFKIYKFLGGSRLCNYCSLTLRCSSSSGHEERSVSLCLPRSALDLGTPPRLCYPLVVFLVRGDAREAGLDPGHDPTPDPGLELHPDESVALVNVVHIKDSVCTLPTSILAQYLKQANGQLSCLKVRLHGQRKTLAS